MARSAIRPSKRAARKVVAKPEAAVASGARTANGNSPSFDIAGNKALAADIVVTAFSGTTPTLRVALEVSNDGGTTWYEAGRNSLDIVGNGTTRRIYETLGGVLGRWRYDIAGTTPSFTFSIAASEVVSAR